VHAYGEAIDVNPVQNPYVFNGVAQPVAGKAYIDRSDVRAGMAEVGGVLNDAFASVGWFWEDDGTHHRTTSTSPRPAVEKVLPLLARSRDRIVIAPLSSQSASALEHQRSAPACNAAADAVAGASKSGQLITVVSPTLRSQNATLEFLVRRGGCFRLADGPYPALVGLNGLSTHHHEGDNTTPIGLFGIQSTMYGVLPNPGVAYQYHHLVCGDWWDEQPSSALYNHFVHVPCGTKPDFGGGSEALWQTVPPTTTSR